MSSKSPRSYTFSSIYLGDAAPASGILTRVNNIRTGGNRVVDSTPTLYIPHLGFKVVTGPREVSVTTSFYDKSTNDVAKLVARGISLSGSFSDTSDLQTYAMLLVAPDEDLEDSYYIPKINSEIRYDLAYAKSEGVIVPIRFSITANEISTILYYKDTVAELITQMGSRSPL